MSAEVKSGSMLGHYELLTRLGRGGMASVWVARERAPSGKQRLVAVKAMLPELARHSEEGQIVRSIDHPNVVKVHEVSEDKGILYMAMEWVEGDSLRTVIKEAKRRRAIPAEMAVKIIADTAAGLHAAHELRGWDGELRNIVHCDVSPHNILVGLDGVAKLVDFGVANATAHSVIDAEDKIKGKFGYMSPEQASAGAVDRRSDVFALGIVLFELTTGERLFRGDDPPQTLELVKNGRIPSPKEFYPQFPDRLAAILKRALARNVNERYQTAAEFRDALEHYLKEERIMISHAGVGQLVKRVLGSRIEQQRQALREALTVADGTIVSGLVPDQSAAPERSTSGVSGPRFPVPSEPPTSTSQFSNSRTGTPRPQTLDRQEVRSGGVLPLFAAVGGIAAAASAIFWVTHRPNPAPLILNSSPVAPTAQAATNGAKASDSNGPTGVSIDSLPMAGANAPLAPNSTANAAALAAAAHKGAHPDKSATKDDAKKDSVEAAPAPPPAPEVAPPPDPPKPAEPAVALPPPDQRAPLNRGAALTALSNAANSAMGCKRPDGPTGSGTATVTFSPDGPVKSVSVSAPFAGTPVGQCVANAFRGAHVPPFSGSAFTLPKSFQIPD
jgi:serine/threonine-protein kinase